APLRESLAIYRELYPRDDSQWVPVQRGLAQSYLLTGQPAAAEPLFRELAALQTRKGDAAGAQVSRSLLARALLDQGKAAEAEPTAREVLAERLRALAAESWQVGSAESLYGACLAKLGRGADAEPLLLSGYRKARAQLGLSDPLTRTCVQRLVAFY